MKRLIEWLRTKRTPNTGSNVPQQKSIPPMPPRTGVHTPIYRRPAAPPPPSPWCTRPCEVDGQICTFHRWVDEDKALLKINAFTSPSEQEYIVRRFKDEGVAPNYCSTEIIRHTYALIEYPDGSAGKVEPETVCFIDREEKKNVRF